MTAREPTSGNVGAEDDIRIEKLGPRSATDLFDQCGQLHIKIISDGFLTRLGPLFLSAFYRSLASIPQSFLLVALRRDEVVGLIAGSTDSKGLVRRFMLTRAWRFAPHMARIVLRPAFLKKIFEVIVYPSKQEFNNLPDAEIVNFCISTAFQGRGLGRRMFEALVDEFAKKQIDKIRIVTGAAQISAQHFYNAVGAEQVGDINVHEGDSSLVFIYSLKVSTRSSA